MSTLKQRIGDEVKAAMRKQDKPRLGVLRLLSAAIKQREVDQREELDDTAVLAVLDKLSKQHRDAIEQFSAAGRDDLVQKETFELGVVQEFLYHAQLKGAVIPAAAAGRGGTAGAGAGGRGRVRRGLHAGHGQGHGPAQAKSPGPGRHGPGQRPGQTGIKLIPTHP